MRSLTCLAEAGLFAETMRTLFQVFANLLASVTGNFVEVSLSVISLGCHFTGLVDLSEVLGEHLRVQV